MIECFTVYQDFEVERARAREREIYIDRSDRFMGVESFQISISRVSNVG